MLLVDGLEVFGMGNWEAIAEYISTKTITQCLDHYIDAYTNSSTFPIPVLIQTVFLLKDMSKTFTKRITHTIAPKEKKLERPPASNPLNHEVGGYMPARKEFEQEYFNDAEQMVKDMEFDETDTPEDIRLKSYTTTPPLE